jgi:sec-independent protein translocase protein TatA
MASIIGFDIGGPEAIIVLVIVLVLFGGSQIPKLARNLGRAQKEFKDGIDEGQRTASASRVTETTATPAATAPAPTPPVSNPPASSPTPDGSNQSSN